MLRLKDFINTSILVKKGYFVKGALLVGNFTLRHFYRPRFHSHTLSSNVRSVSHPTSRVLSQITISRETGRVLLTTGTPVASLCRDVIHRYLRPSGLPKSKRNDPLVVLHPVHQWSMRTPPLSHAPATKSLETHFLKDG